MGGGVFALEIVPNHVHLQFEVDPQMGTSSSFVSTTGKSPLDAIREYVENQKRS